MPIPAYTTQATALTAPEVLPLIVAPAAAPVLNLTPNGLIVRIQPVQEFSIDRVNASLAGTPPSGLEVAAVQPNAIGIVSYPVDVDEDTNSQVFVFDGTAWNQVPIATIPNRYELTLPLASSVPEFSWVRVINFVGADGNSGCSETNVIRINVPGTLQGEANAGQFVDITTFGETNELQSIDGGWTHRASADLPLIDFSTFDPQGQG